MFGFRMAIEGEHYPSMERRERSLPSRSADYYTVPRRTIEPRAAEYAPRGGDYGTKVDDSGYDIYPNGRYPREYYAYPREHR